MGTTPVYGIRYPDRTTTLKDLGDRLGIMGDDIERALATAGVTPVTNPQIIAAPSAGARDAYWGVPGTDAARLALQAKGAQTVRTDLGWTEQYYAPYNAASNPQGALNAGWYPAPGHGPLAMLTRNAPIAVGAAWATIAFEAAPVNAPAPFALWSAGAPSRITFPIAGLYEMSHGLQQAGIVACSDKSYRNGSSVEELAFGDARTGASGAAANPKPYGIVSVAAGDYIEMKAFAASTVNFNVAPLYVKYYSIRKA